MQCESNSNRSAAKDSSASTAGEIPVDNMKAMKAGKIVLMIFKSLYLGFCERILTSHKIDIGGNAMLAGLDDNQALFIPHKTIV